MQEILLLGVGIPLLIGGVTTLLMIRSLDGSERGSKIPKWVPVTLMVAAGLTFAVAAFL